MTTPHAIRTEALAELRDMLVKIRKRNPQIRSLMMGVGQYWADEADDAVHANIYASPRETPLWPPEEIELIEEDGEWFYLPFDDNGSAIDGFAAFCTEDGSQEDQTCESYRPYAIARLRADDTTIDVEVVGVRRRFGDELLAPLRSFEEVAWPDARSLALFAEVCAHGADDGPRHVLADHLQEKSDPRGEYLALALTGNDRVASHAGGLDREREAALLAEHQVAWLGPLAKVIAPGDVRFERGFPIHVEIYAPSPEHVAALRGSRVWGTIETVWIQEGSHGVLDEAMVALRDIGPLRTRELEILADATTPWALEHVFAVLDEGDAELLVRAPVPKLRRLTIAGEVDGAFPILATAPWWPTLERFTILQSLASDPEWSSTARLPPYAVGAYDDVLRPVGFQLLFDTRNQRIDVELVGWHPDSTIEALAARIKDAADIGPIRLVPSRCWTPTAEDAANLARATGKTVTL